jgi:hypothetical protein
MEYWGTRFSDAPSNEVVTADAHSKSPKEQFKFFLMLCDKELGNMGKQKREKHSSKARKERYSEDVQEHVPFCLQIGGEEEFCFG